MLFKDLISNRTNFTLTVSRMKTSISFVIILSLIGSEVVSAKNHLFIFGDSTVDPGNNNYIETIPNNRANYKPYGRNGFFSNPTGRFSDGRIIVDFLAEYAELPLIPAFLDPSGDDYSYGVNFASGGAGILSTTNQGQGVIDLATQLKYFEEVERRLKEKSGEAEADKVISSAVYFISMGSNDYLGGYLGDPRMQELHLPEHYVGMVIGNLTQTIQELYKKGARKFGFLSLSPLGCLPVLRAMNPKPSQGGCFEQANALALGHNNALKTVLTSLEHLLPDFKYCNSDFYLWLLDRIDNPSNYGFKEGKSACCGTGPYSGVYSCGGTKEVATYELCDNGEDYVWWDSYHPTERIHEQFAKALWDGLRPAVGPYNLRDMFLYDPKQKQTIADVVDDTVPEVEQIKE
ncbi:GDSL esterase/lipase 5-like [Andrographis paniculata]|uniref:GDSL esterase/lipase 5-like n=1 Tax=Andrographis paniculata TaxID=175694 RepID=UPI0021E8B087|nr:GDSL esterase/lipase 5-like [Andrographis paniculata]